VMMGLECFDASNGGPGGGVCARAGSVLIKAKAKTTRKLKR